MRFLKKKMLWFIGYGIFITLVFLYLLFPGELVKSKLEDSINASGLTVKSASLHPALPLGIKLKNVTISSAAQEFILFQGELLLSLIHISEPTRRTPISYAVFCL